GNEFMSPTSRLAGLDLLRALAIIAVVAHHLLDIILPRDGPHWLVAIFSWGNSGVDLFFVLSGYLISRIILSEIHKEGQLRLCHFWHRRWMRTLPAYYAILAVIAVSDWVGTPDH